MEYLESNVCWCLLVQVVLMLKDIKDLPITCLYIIHDICWNSFRYSVNCTFFDVFHAL
jgi:hypothetical protein